MAAGAHPGLLARCRCGPASSWCRRRWYVHRLHLPPPRTARPTRGATPSPFTRPARADIDAADSTLVRRLSSASNSPRPVADTATLREDPTETGRIPQRPLLPRRSGAGALQRGRPDSNQGQDLPQRRVIAQRNPRLGADPRRRVGHLAGHHGEVRLGEIARLLGRNEHEARRGLSNRVFDDPGSDAGRAPAPSWTRSPSCCRALAHPDQARPVWARSDAVEPHAGQRAGGVTSPGRFSLPLRLSAGEVRLSPRCTALGSLAARLSSVVVGAPLGNLVQAAAGIRPPLPVRRQDYNRRGEQASMAAAERITGKRATVKISQITVKVQTAIG